MQTALETIARKHLNLDTLDTRNSGALDFREQAVWQVRAALEAAYAAGVASVAQPRRWGSLSPIQAAKAADVPFDDALILQSANTRLLSSAALGRLDLNGLARNELASRGLDQTGRWVGFDKATRLAAKGR